MQSFVVVNYNGIFSGNSRMPCAKEALVKAELILQYPVHPFRDGLFVAEVLLCYVNQYAPLAPPRIGCCSTEYPYRSGVPTRTQAGLSAEQV